MVRRVHDEDSGKYGNDTKLDLWQDTSGDYKGLDRFGRIIDMKFTDFSGSAVDFARLKYTYDRNSNRLSIEDAVYKANSQSFTYDNLNRLTEGRRGILDSGNAVQKSDVAENFGMDLLGNFTSAAGAIKVNSSGSSTVTHAVNATNEITTLGVPNPAGAPKLINEPFTTSLSSFWSADKGTWSISSSQVNVDTLTSGDAVLLADAKLDLINYEFKVTFPTSSSTNKAGLVFAHDGANSYHAVVLNRTTGKIALYKITSGSWGGVLASATASIADSTQYTIKVLRRQMSVDAWVVGQSTATFSYSGSTDFGTGKSGFYSDKTGVKFDDFVAHRGDAKDPSVPRFTGNVDMAIVSGKLVVTGTTRGGVAIADNSNGGQYRIQAVVDRNGGEADIWFHYTDPNNGYRLRYGTALENMTLQRVENGEWYTEGTYYFEPPVGDSVTFFIEFKNNYPSANIKVYIAGTLRLDETVAFEQLSGTVAFGGDQAKFDGVKVGYDNNTDHDLDDAGDTLMVSEDFGSTDTTIVYDKAGNLIDDGSLQYVYDAWNRLVKVRSAKTGNTTIQTAEFDGLGRRIKKVVTNSGEHDGTTVFYFDGQKTIETRDGSGNLVQQFIHGTRYVDELVQMRVKDKGDLYVHQDANWNVTGLTDLGGSIVERYLYTPYGELTVHQDTSYGDRDGDNDVDSTDKGKVGSTCTGTVTGACRILDLDFDGDYDSTDATKFDALPQGLARHPGKTSTGVHQPFAHQGLLYEPEIASYQNRARQYDAAKRRFDQQDSAGYSDGMGLYEYCQSKPLEFLDPTGESVSYVTQTPTEIIIGIKIVFWGYRAWQIYGPTGNPRYVDAANQISMRWNRSHRVRLSLGSCKTVRFQIQYAAFSDEVYGGYCHNFNAPSWNGSLIAPYSCYDQAKTLSGMDFSHWISMTARVCIESPISSRGDGL